ncbi:AAA family ATPase [Streptomyces wedmorensis]
MIHELEIKRFKCFGHVDLPMRPLTILTGLNGGGKSTVLQALLLARLADTSPQRTVRLNGPYGLALGTATEVLHQAATESAISIRVATREQTRGWAYEFAVPEEPEALHLTATSTPDTPAPGIGNPPAAFTYLCAERLGPRDALSLSAEEPDEIGVGTQGEYTAQVLALRDTRMVSARRSVRADLLHPDLDSPLPRLQAEAWASEIIRPVGILAQHAPGILASTIRFREKDSYGETIRPANTGFGVSYALPIIVAGLLSMPGDLLLVENPEAHLHPAGQSRLGNFLARVAGSGVQVVLETHSDHVLNGARLAVAQDQLLASEDVIVHYFDDSGVQSIEVNEQGELDHWPGGFFDQIETDLGRLARARRRR